MIQKKKNCPKSSELDRAFSEGVDQTLETHLKECDLCASEWEAKKRLVEAARALPVFTLSIDQKEEIRLRLATGARALVSNKVPGTRRLVAWALAVGLSVIILVAILTLITKMPQSLSNNGKSSQPVYRAILYPHDGTHFTRVSEQPDEIVRLFEGSMTVKVLPLQPNERFRVITGDAEVEVHGTVFDIEAKSDRISLVRVVRGRVEVRSVNSPVHVIGPGEKWEQNFQTKSRMGNSIHQETTAAEDKHSPEDHLSPGISKGIASKEKSHQRSDTSFGQNGVAKSTSTPSPIVAEISLPSKAELAFQEGWSALRAGNPDKAAQIFAQVESGTTISEDAAYWKAVALVRAGYKKEGIVAFEQFLNIYPTSTRLGEASVALGWLLYERGDLKGAADRFNSARNDPDSRVRESALRGLQRLNAQ